MSGRLPAAAKALMLAPFVVLLYHSDLGTLAFSASPQLIALGASSALVLALAAVLKRRVFLGMLELSKPSFGWGAGLLAAFALLYAWGPYSPQPGYFRYESLCALVLGYAAFRVGAGAVRAGLPLAAAAALASPSPAAAAAAGSPLAPLVAGIFTAFLLALFLVQVGFNLRPAVAATAIAAAGLAAYAWPAVVLGPVAAPTWALLPLLVVPFASARVRRFCALESSGARPACPGHRPLHEGYCALCGARVSAPAAPEPFAYWGLAAVALTTAILLVASVPTLALVGGSPYDAAYTPQGVAVSATPAVPQGWQVNSSAVVHVNETQPLAARYVFVPLVHPEERNYTMYYAISTTAPSFQGVGGDLKGWRTLWSNLTQLGPFQGHLTAYRGAGGALFSYVGTARMTFMEGSAFRTMDVGVAFTRQFKDGAVARDSSAFVGDLGSLWSQAFQNDAYYSQWTQFVSASAAGASYLAPFAATIASASAIAWAAYVARDADLKLDGFIRRASRLPRAQWDRLSALLALPGMTGTGAEFLAAGAADDSLAVRAAAELEEAGVVSRIYVDRGADVALEWRAGP